MAAQACSVVNGSFHQGCIELFGTNSGKQCTCMALFSVVFSLIKPCSRWTQQDLDLTLMHGDSLYNQVGHEQYLLVSELPRQLEISKLKKTIVVQFHEPPQVGILAVSNPCTVPVLDTHLRDIAAYSGSLFIVRGSCIGILFQAGFYYVFDSHSRDSSGIPCASGASVLLKFYDSISVAQYVMDVYGSETQCFQYENTFVTVDSSCFGEPYVLRRQVIRHLKRCQRNLHRNPAITICYRPNNCVDQVSSSFDDIARVSVEKHDLLEDSELFHKNICIDHVSSSIPNMAGISSTQRDVHEDLEFLNGNICTKPTPETFHRDVTNVEEQSGKQDFLHSNPGSQFDALIPKFHKLVRQGPFHVCVTCNRSLYRASVKLFHRERYAFDLSLMEHLDTGIVSDDGKSYICVTCDSQLKKGKMPKQAVANSLCLGSIPEELLCLNRLELMLVCKRYLFKKVLIMPKGQQPKVKGAIVNVPINVSETFRSLPNGKEIILLKLKKKLQFKGHVCFEPVRPAKVRDALLYLKAANLLYSDTEVALNGIPGALLSEENANEAADLASEPPVIESEDEGEDAPDPLGTFRSSSNESVMISDRDVFQISPGEDCAVQNMLLDSHCEELAFPQHFPDGKNAYSYDRSVKLELPRYINQRLLNYTQRFASDSDYIFWAQSVLQQKYLHEQISIAMRKKAGSYTAGRFTDNYNDSVQELMNGDQGFQFMSQIRGSPAYWKRFQGEVLAMIKQLGCPALFLTLSCADLRWNELIEIIERLNGNHKADSSREELNYYQRCQVLNSNPVLLARHFQYRVETLFREIVLLPSGPLGSITKYAIRVEFQVRGSPHVHCFLWLKDSSEFDINCTDFIDSVVQADLPSPDQDPTLHHHVLTYQVHKHSRSCRKYKNSECRYHFGRFFTERTIVAKPLCDVSDYERYTILQKRSKILSVVKVFVDKHLFPDQQGTIPDEYHDINDVLSLLGISPNDYYWALSISPDDEVQVHLKRQTNACFVNNYNLVLLRAWQANMDIQPVCNYYKAVSYMAAYFSKSETDTSEALREALKEIESSDLHGKDAMNKLASSFVNSRQLSVQEAVYFCLPELWLRKCHPGVSFINTNVPEKRYRVLKSAEELSQLPCNSEDIFKNGVIERYLDRPHVLDQMCLAQFASLYHKIAIDSNDYQPSQIAYPEDSSHSDTFPRRIYLPNLSEVMVRRNSRLVLRYFTPNEVVHPEEYAHHMLRLFYPHRAQLDLSIDGNYSCKLYETSVLSMVNQNKRMFEPHGELVDSCWIRVQTSQSLERRLFEDRCDADILMPHEEADTAECNAMPSFASAPGRLISDADLFQMINCLNAKQREVFNLFCTWSRKKLRISNSNVTEVVNPIRVFLSGGAGVGKSHLVKTVSTFLTKTFCFHSGCPDKLKVLILAPTGVAAINVGGTTINSGLGIPPNIHSLPKLSDMKRALLRNLYSDVVAVIIDEISMVSNKLFMHTHFRLCDIFGCQYNIPFSCLAVLAVGDLYQLPPVKAHHVFRPCITPNGCKYEMWSHFCLCELTDVVRQKGDNCFINLLNNVRVGSVTQDDLNLINTRKSCAESLPSECTVVFAENQPKDEYNKLQLDFLQYPTITVDAIDKYPPDTPGAVMEKFRTKSQSATGGLATLLSLKKGARVMLTSNIDISDRLINGQMGYVHDFVFTESTITKIYVKFDDVNAGRRMMAGDTYALARNLVPIKRTEAEVPLGRSGVSCSSVKRTQFPLMLSWACTIHKVQGLTLNKLAVSVNLLKQRQFGFGQIYVALSRTTSLDNLFILGNISAEHVRSSEDVAHEYAKLRCTANYFDRLTYEASSPFLMYVNIRGLKKNFENVVQDSRLAYVPILCFSETHTSDSSILTSLLEKYPTHSLLHGHSPDMYESLAILYNSCCFVCEESQVLNGVLYSHLRSCTDENMSFRMLLLYRKCGSNVPNFIELITYMIQCKDVDLLIGDMNENYLNHGPISSALQKLNFVQIVSEPTHLQGALLDHVYVKSSSLIGSLHATVVSVFFSDHEAILLHQ